MTLIASFLSDARLSLPFWEAVEYIATGIVILGAIGEYLAEFRRFPKEQHKREQFAKLSALVLIAGLAVELVGLVRTSQLSGQIIAELNREAEAAGRDAATAKATAKGFERDIADANSGAKNAEAQVASANAQYRDAQARVASAEVRIADAKKQAAEANRAAEQERLERLKLEAQVAPRRLSPDQQRAIATACRRFSGRRVSVTTYSLDAEGGVLGKQIIAVLQAAGITTDDHTASLMPLGGFALGVHINGSEQDLVTALATYLSSIGQLAVATNTDQKAGAAISSGASSTNTPAVSILVGVKPVVH